ncbi:unnamed protein product [Rodentolepis nana]|uniref:UBZ3-type domain-containing protein n=1 Tax=Rodentolepis nana TaxID=102285 RepID=A0A0R3TAW3_RODNA|nr:unnamed protein product [Rodentolepis nana]
MSNQSVEEQSKRVEVTSNLQESNHQVERSSKRKFEEVFENLIEQSEDCNSEISRYKMLKILRYVHSKIPRGATDAGNVDTSVKAPLNTKTSSELNPIFKYNPPDSLTSFRERRPIVPFTTNSSDVTNATPAIDSAVTNGLKITSEMNPNSSQSSSDAESSLSSPKNSNMVSEISVSKGEWAPPFTRNAPRNTLPSALPTDSSCDDIPNVLTISFRRNDASDSRYVPTVTSSFDTPLSSKFDITWLKIPEISVTKRSPVEFQRNTAPSSSLNKTTATAHKYVDSGLLFKNFESYFDHIIHQNSNEYCSGIQKYTSEFLSKEQCSSGVNASTIAMDSTDYPLKRISNRSANLPLLSGVEAIDSKSTEEEKVNSGSCVKSVEKNDEKLISMCPPCNFSKTSREAILEHIPDKH